MSCPQPHRSPFNLSPPSTHQIILSTAHPAKFSEAVTRALSALPSSHSNFDFEKDVLPDEFRGLLEKEKRVIEVERPDVGLVKAVIEGVVGRDEEGVVNGAKGSV